MEVKASHLIREFGRKCYNGEAALLIGSGPSIAAGLPSFPGMISVCAEKHLDLKIMEWRSEDRHCFEHWRVIPTSQGAAHILAAVTREEHTGGIPDLPSTVEAVRAAKVAAHIIDMHLLGDVAADWAVVKDRVSYRTCVAGKVSRGCARCGITCPL